jgi:hypothetical protein
VRVWITGAAHRGLPDDEMVDVGVLASVRGVVMKPGCGEFTRMSSWAKVIAALLDMFRTAPLVAWLA